MRLDLVGAEHPLQGLLDASPRPRRCRGGWPRACGWRCRGSCRDRPGSRFDGCWPRRRTPRPAAFIPPRRGNSSPTRLSQAFEVGHGAEDLDDLGQLLGRRASSRSGRGGRSPLMSWRPPIGGEQPGGEGVGHFSGEGLSSANLAQVAQGLQRACRVLAERARGVTGQGVADLGEIEQFQGVRIHEPRAEDALSDAAGKFQIRSARPAILAGYRSGRREDLAGGGAHFAGATTFIRSSAYFFQAAGSAPRS